MLAQPKGFEAMPLFLRAVANTHFGRLSRFALFTISLSLMLKMGQAWPNSVSLWVWEGKEKRGWQCGTNQGPLENRTVGGRTHGGSLGKGCHLGTFYRHHLNPCSNNPGTTLGSEVARRQRKFYWENGERTVVDRSVQLSACLVLRLRVFGTVFRQW